MLRATQGDNQQEKTQLNKDLQFAEKQVNAFFPILWTMYYFMM